MTDITEQLKALVEAGDEANVRAFVAEHFAQLPESLQRELGVEMLKEAFQDEIDERQAVIDAKKEAAALIDELDKLERENG